MYRKGVFRVTLITTLILAGLWLVFIGRNVSSVPPINPTIADKTSNSFSVIWLTKRETNSRLVLVDADNKNILKTVRIFPDFYSNWAEGSVVHFVQLKGLKSNHRYALKVINGFKVYNIGKVQTLPQSANIPQLKAAFGQVVDKDNKGLSNVLVEVYKKGNPQIRLTALSNENGFWAANVADLKLQDGDKLIVKVLTKDGQMREDSNDSDFIQPVRLIKI